MIRNRPCGANIGRQPNGQEEDFLENVIHRNLGSGVEKEGKVFEAEKKQ